MDSTPAQRLFSRSTRTSLPMASHLLQPKVIPDVHRNFQQRQNKQALFFNRGARPLQPLRDGDVVWVRPLPGHSRCSRWFKAQVSSQEAPRCYRIHTEDGRVYRRNRSNLYKVPENFQAMPDEDIVESKVNVKVDHCENGSNGKVGLSGWHGWMIPPIWVDVMLGRYFHSPS